MEAGTDDLAKLMVDPVVVPEYRYHSTSGVVEASANVEKYVSPSIRVLGPDGTAVAMSMNRRRTALPSVRAEVNIPSEFAIHDGSLKPYDAAGQEAAVKSVAEVAVTPATATVIFPDVAPAGTVVVMLVAVDAVTVAAVPLNVTVLSAGVVLKFVPVMVTVAPTTPDVGVKLVMVGSVKAGTVTVKSVAEVAARAAPATATEIGPVVAPTGTVVLMLVVVDAVTVAAVPLNVTVLLAGVALKLVPLMVTNVPTIADVGEKPVMVGSGRVAVKSVAEVAVMPSTTTVILPVVAPTGTVVVISVAVNAVMVARLPLIRTVLRSAIVLKFRPEMVIVSPATPNAGVKPVMAGGGKSELEPPQPESTKLSNAKAMKSKTRRTVLEILMRSPMQRSGTWQVG